MRVRYKSNNVEGYSSLFNVTALSEVLVDGDWGGDSAFIRELEVWLEKSELWKDMRQAFQDRDIIPDNYHRWFGEPKTEEDKERGYFD